MYAVLATVSSGYPPLQGRSSTCYSPVRHFQAYCYTLTFDLHVLSTPPAFILSQDQTLHKELSESSSRCSHTSNSLPLLHLHGTLLVPFELLGFEFDCLSTLQLLRCRPRLPSASPPLPLRFLIDSAPTALRFRRPHYSLSQGQVCSLHHLHPSVKSFFRRLHLFLRSRPYSDLTQRLLLPSPHSLRRLPAKGLSPLRQSQPTRQAQK